jgi:hypothetical protein
MIWKFSVAFNVKEKNLLAVKQHSLSNYLRNELLCLAR